MPLEKLSDYFRGKKDLVGDGVREGSEPGTTEEMPVVPYRVMYCNLPFYSDAECKHQVDGASITVLRPLDPEIFGTLDVVPTTKYYQIGQYLSWKLNKENLWEDCFFRNPETGQIEQAWTVHVEFVGDVISPAAVEKDRKRLDRLEAQFEVSGDQVM